MNLDIFRIFFEWNSWMKFTVCIVYECMSIRIEFLTFQYRGRHLLGPEVPKIAAAVTYVCISKILSLSFRQPF